jgi:hypothetical protein
VLDFLAVKADARRSAEIVTPHAGTPLPVTGYDGSVTNAFFRPEPVLSD